MLTKLWTQHSFIHSTNDQNKHFSAPTTNPQGIAYNLHRSSVTTLLASQILPDFSNLWVGKLGCPSATGILSQNFPLLWEKKEHSFQNEILLSTILEIGWNKNISTYKLPNLLYRTISPGTYRSETDYLKSWLKKKQQKNLLDPTALMIRYCLAKTFLVGIPRRRSLYIIFLQLMSWNVISAHFEKMWVTGHLVTIREY